MFNPFDEIDEPVTPVVEKENKTLTAPVNAKSEGKITVTLKEGTGFDSAWIVVHADDVEEAGRQVGDPKMMELMKLVKSAASHFRGGEAKTAPAPGPRPQAPAQPASPQAPAGDAPVCAHGPRQYRSGVSRAGNPYKGWFCTLPMGAPGQCKAQYL